MAIDRQDLPASFCVLSGIWSTRPGGYPPRRFSALRGSECRPLASEVLDRVWVRTADIAPPEILHSSLGKTSHLSSNRYAIASEYSLSCAG